MNPALVAASIHDAYRRRSLIEQPSATYPGFDLASGYLVERELLRLRTEEGHRSVGWKVGFANRAVWRALKLETLLWAHMYEDTVHLAEADVARLEMHRYTSPKIEPEIVFKLKAPIGPGASAASALDAVEWIALGFEIIDCVYPDWTFQPADFVAAYGLHAALVVGRPHMVTDATIPALVDALPRFTVSLSRDGHVVAEGSGKHCLRSPALCLAELAAALSASAGAEGLAVGDLVSSGTLTDSQPLAAGQTWTATVEGLDLTPLTLHT